VRILHAIITCKITLSHKATEVFFVPHCLSRLLLVTVKIAASHLEFINLCQDGANALVYLLPNKPYLLNILSRLVKEYKLDIRVQVEAVLEFSFVEVWGEKREREREREKLPRSCITVDGEQGEG